jgi:hypothetical protein
MKMQETNVLESKKGVSSNDIIASIIFLTSFLSYFTAKLNQLIKAYCK